MAYQQTQAKGLRQQLLAQALAGQAFNPPQRQQGRIVANTGLADGLGILGAALASRRMGKKAEATTSLAEEERRQAQAAALGGLSRPPNAVETPEAQSPYSRAQSAAEAGVDPNVVGAYLKQQMPTSDGGSASVQGYKLAKEQGYQGSYTDYKREFEGREANIPAALQVWNVYKNLPPEQRAAFVESQRNIPIEDVNQVPTRVLPGAVQQPLSTLENEANAARTVKAAESTGTTTGQAQGTAIANLPIVLSTGQQALDTAEKLLNHPGRHTATGLSGTIDPRNYIPGTNAKDFEILRKQALGQVFLDAYQSLKGGGPITDIEGKKAEEAKARMDRAQSDKEFETALKDYTAAIRRGLELAKAKAGLTTAPPATPPTEPKTVHWNDL